MLGATVQYCKRHRDGAADMRIGEVKTVAAVLPAYHNALFLCLASDLF